LWKYWILKKKNLFGLSSFLKNKTKQTKKTNQQTKNQTKPKQTENPNSTQKS